MRKMMNMLAAFAEFAGDLAYFPRLFRLIWRQTA
jgi:hypothetical protein